MVERNEGEGGLPGPNQRVPSNRPTGCPRLRPLSLLGQLCEMLREARARGEVGRLYYIYEALSKQSNNIDSAPRSDRPSQRTPSHDPLYARYVYTLPAGSRRPYSFHSETLFRSPFAFNARRMRPIESPRAHVFPRVNYAVTMSPPWLPLLLLFRCW